METVSRQTSTTKPCIALVLIAPRPRQIIRIKIIRIWTEISDLDRYLPHHTLLRDLDTTHWPQRRFAQRSRFRPRGERGVLAGTCEGLCPDPGPKTSIPVVGVPPRL